MSERYGACHNCLGEGHKHEHECMLCGGTGFNGSWVLPRIESFRKTEPVLTDESGSKAMDAAIQQFERSTKK